MSDETNPALSEPKKKPILKIALISVAMLLAVALSIGGTLLLTGVVGKKHPDVGAEVDDEEAGPASRKEAGADAPSKPAAPAGAAKGGGKSDSKGDGKGDGKGGLPQKKPLPADAAARFEKSYMELDDKKPLVANIFGSRKVVQVSVSLMTQYDERVFKNVERHRAALRSICLDTLRQATEADLAKPEFRAELAVRLREKINKELERLENFGGIEEVFFTEFVYQ